MTERVQQPKAPVLMVAAAVGGLLGCPIAGVFDIIEGSTAGFIICAFATAIFAFDLWLLLTNGRSNAQPPQTLPEPEHPTPPEQF